MTRIEIKLSKELKIDICMKNLSKEIYMYIWDKFKNTFIMTESNNNMQRVRNICLIKKNSIVFIFISSSGSLRNAIK